MHSNLKIHGTFVPGSELSLELSFPRAKVPCSMQLSLPKGKQESCAIAKMTAQCALS